jgi:hypothetical protein
VSDDAGVPGGGSLVPGGDVGALAGILLVVQMLESLQTGAVVSMRVLD